MKRKSFFTILISVSMLLTGPASAFATENTEVFFVDEYGGDENTEVFYVEENAAEAQTEAEPAYAPSAKLITGFRPLSEDKKTLAFYKDEKPSLEELLRQLPGELSAFTESGEELIPVSWYSVGADFDSPEAHYFQFSPRWNRDAYRVGEDFDIVKSAPYIEVFILERESAPEEGAQTGTEPQKTPEKIILNYDQSANKNRIYDYLTGVMGFNTAAACGVLANIYCESGFNPNALGDGGTSYGICQWHNGRYQNLKNYCGEHGLDYRSLDGQLAFLDHELNNSYGSTLRLLRSLFNEAEAAYYAGYSWCYNFERPKNYPSVSVTRGNLSRDKYWAACTGEKSSGLVELEQSRKTAEKAVEASDPVSTDKEEAGDTQATETEALPESDNGNAEVVRPVIGISQNEINLISGGSGVKPEIRVTPEDTELMVSWRSSDTDIAYVSADGFVLPKAAGQALITATVTVLPGVSESGDGEKDSEAAEEAKDAEPEASMSFTCLVNVTENDTSAIKEAGRVEKRTAPGGPVKLGRYERYVSIGISYDDAVTYTGKETDPVSDLNAVVDISGLTAVIDELGMIRKGELTADELFSIAFVTENGRNVGQGSFYPVIELDADAASDSRLKRREVAELKLVLEELNAMLSADKCVYTINPIDISSKEVSVRLRLRNKELAVENNEVTNIRTVKIIDENRNVYALNGDQYETALMDIGGKVLLKVTGDERFAGLRAVTIED